MGTSGLDRNSQRKRDAWAEKTGTDVYVCEMGDYARRRDQAVVRAMLGVGPGRLLDIPCGTGRYLDLAIEAGFEVTAADFSPTMLAAAPRRDRVSYLRADVFNPPFMPDSFDVILVSRLLFHYANPERIVASLLPALKPNGRMVFDTLNPYSTRWLASMVLGRFRKDPARKLYYESPTRLHGKLAALGLSVIASVSAYLLPTRCYRLLPRAMASASDSLERRAVPRQLRVVTFWHVCRAGQTPTLRSLTPIDSQQTSERVR